jgi:hypothetical protein
MPNCHFGQPAAVQQKQDNPESFAMVVNVNALQVSSLRRAGMLSNLKNSTSSLSS